MKQLLRPLYKIVFCFSMLTLLLSNGAAQTMSKDVEPFVLSVSDAEIMDLNQRLSATRWPHVIEGSAWDYGTSDQYLKELVAYWKKDFHWKLIESNLNKLPQFTVLINNLKVHFLYIKGKGKASTPLVMLHGWPSSFFQMNKIIPLLTAPDQHGKSFDVIVPSLIGYGFSSAPSQKGMSVYAMSEILNTLLVEKLDIQKFIIRASDIGAGVAKEWALAHPQHIIGLHLSGSNPYTFQLPEKLSEKEKAFIENGQKFMMAEGAYAMLQSTKPQTLSYALNDSPVGLASWIVEKYKAWSDNNGNLESKFSKDDILTTISIYWFTHSIGSSMNTYYESAHVWSPNAGKKVMIPTSFMMLENDIAAAPREWEERTYNIVRWNTHPSGGHFGEWEEPSIIASDLVAFRDQLNK